MSSSHGVGRLFSRPGLRAQQTQGRKPSGVVPKSAGRLGPREKMVKDVEVGKGVRG